MKKEMQKIVGNFYHRGLQMLFMGAVTGFFAGTVLTFYNIFASIGEGVSTNVYAYLREHWFLIPLLFAVLAAAAFLVGVIVKLVPMVKGSGIPQTEGVARGVLKCNWFSVFTTKFAVSLACIFLGLSAGSEGPGIQIGGALGYGSSRLFSKTDMLRRYQVTGGACAGLAVAFNAPLTGMAFAFEETHKKFSPEVFICAFSSVATGVITRNLIRGALGYSTGATFSTFVFNDLPYENYGYLICASLVAALIGVVFYHAVVWLKKLMETKVTFCKDTGRMLIPFLVAGIFGLVISYAIGGGHALIEALGTMGGTREMDLQTALALGLGGTLLLAFLAKFITAVLNMSCGVPCGVFIPMLAIGAAAGALISLLFTENLGMDTAYSDLIVMICMAAFFTCVVRAPITAIVMVFELTWSFTSLLPVVIGVAVGYMVGQIAGIKPIYEKMLEQIVEEKERNEQKVFLSCKLTVHEHSIVDGLSIKDVLWPAGAAVKGLKRNQEAVPPVADTVLQKNDEITVMAETADRAGVLKELQLLTGERQEQTEDET